MEQKATREVGATTGTARNEKVERGSQAGGEIERSLGGIGRADLVLVRIWFWSEKVFSGQM